MSYRIFIAALCLTPPAATFAMAETSPANVIGTWQTDIVEQPAPGGTAHLRTTTIFTDTNQELIVSVYADAGLEMKLFEYASGGPWQVQGPSEAVPGAMAIDLVNDYSLVTIFVDAPDLWAAISLAECPLTIGEAVEISDCVNGPPFGVTACVDMDIVLVDQDGRRLRYGGGDVDRCVTRPTEASADAFFRVE